VEIDGELVRACATLVSPDMSVQTTTTRAQSARTEGFDRILINHFLNCTVSDNNNVNCTVHNTTKNAGHGTPQPGSMKLDLP
jgi:formate dehydrogenase major subunit